ncbi:hypothetical protein AOQ84DRAFT_283938, partial [Glonium stellatum]
MVVEFPETYIVLDALDECDDRGKTLDIIWRLESLKSKNLHILVASRKEADIERSIMSFLSAGLCVDLQAAPVDEDIRSYVSYRWSNDKNLERWKGKPEIQAEVEAALFKRSNGMFRWTACQLDALGSCLTRAKLRKALQNLPPTLAETYERILVSIGPNADYAQQILRWLTFSKEPLSTEQIAEVVAIDVDNGGVFDEDGILESPNDVLTICSSLVAITKPRRNRRIVSLAHYSVQEYLLSIPMGAPSPIGSYRIESSETNAFIAQGCLVYLLRFQDPEKLLTEK